MNQIKLNHILIENFKGIKSLDIDFGDVTQIYGRNASGKTTISDAFSWLLFDKDSTGSSSFAIRPKDADGKDIDNIEIKVEATLDVDGEEIVLTKVQKQKWTKHRGSTAPTFEGNVNEFQVNGFPAKKAEYEAKIHSLIDESLFKLLTNPRTFAAMKWQDQRSTLMEFVSDITDAEILATNPIYEPIEADVLAAGSDKAREKAAAALRSLKKLQDEYPVRIDEAMRNIGGFIANKEELLQKRTEIETEINTIQNERKRLSAGSEVVTDIQNQIVQKRSRMAEIERHAMIEDEKRILDAVTAANKTAVEVKKIEAERDALWNRSKYISAQIDENKKAKTELKDQYMAAMAEKFPEGETICPTCGRPFEAEKIEEAKTAWEARKKAKIDAINQKGFSLKAAIDSAEREFAANEEKIANLAELVKKKDAEWRVWKDKSELKEKTDVTVLPEYIRLQKECDDLDVQLASLNTNDDEISKLGQRETEARRVLAAVSADLAKIEANEHLKDRVEELKAEQRECGQKVADQEQLVWLLEEFAKQKMDLLSGRINDHFKKVRFRLFTEQINGGVKETCTMQINTNGSYVDYSDANNAAKIIGGLDVIEALSELYGVTAPIFLDNAEAIDSFNTPEMDAQLILLEVSDDEKLVIERR